MPGAACPNLADFQAFVTNVMGIPLSVLDPTTAPVVTYAFDFALNTVNCLIGLARSQPSAYSLYQLAVYNLAGDTLINWAQDAADAPIFKNDLPYWQYLRDQYGILNFVPGVVQSTSDEATSSSYAVPDQLRELTIANLGNLKTPFGRTYLGIAGSWGSVWGMN